MTIITIIRKSGKTIIEIPDNTNIAEVLQEHGITTYESITVLTNQKELNDQNL